MSDQSMTLEAERQFYLESAGIRLWYARAPLPGAAASADFDFTEPDLPESVAEEEPRAVPRSASHSSKSYGKSVSTETARARLQGLMSETRGKPAAPTVPSPVLPASTGSGAQPAALSPSAELQPETEPKTEVAESSRPVSSVESRLKIHWGLWLGGRHVLISERSADASVALQDELAQNILKALGDTVESTLVVQWPVFNNAQVPGTDNAGLKVLLKQVIADFGKRSVIALGLLPEGLDAQRQAWFDELFGQLAVDSPYSVAMLAAQASYKRELWLQLKSWRQGV